MPHVRQEFRVPRLANAAKFRNVPIMSRRATSRRTNWGEAQLKGVRVTAAARLHLGFLDLNGDLGRKFGSIGLAISAFETCVQLRQALRFETSGEERERGARLALRIAELLDLDTAKELIISNAIPAHAGLGSGTQLAIAIASAFRCLSGLPLDARSDARLLDRGARSGVGAALFESGGLVVDAGIGPSGEIPPAVARVRFPADWRVLLVLDQRVQGAHGEAERQAFARLPRMSADFGGRNLPSNPDANPSAAAERDFAAFGQGVCRVQEIVGDHFAPVQGGGRFASAAVAAVEEKLAAHGATGIGQSSWGPTGFAFARDPDHAHFLAGRALDVCEPGVRIIICEARDRGAEIREDEHEFQTR